MGRVNRLFGLLVTQFRVYPFHFEEDAANAMNLFLGRDVCKSTSIKLFIDSHQHHAIQ